MVMVSKWKTKLLTKSDQTKWKYKNCNKHAKKITYLKKAKEEHQNKTHRYIGTEKALFVKV